MISFRHSIPNIKINTPQTAIVKPIDTFNKNLCSFEAINQYVIPTAILKPVEM